jgi:hypothetical protein
MSEFKCPHCSFDPGAHAWSRLVLTRHKSTAHGIAGSASFNGKRFEFPGNPFYRFLARLFPNR